MCRCQKLDFSFFAFSYANKFEVSFMKNYNYFFERCPCYRNRTFWEIDFFSLEALVLCKVLQLTYIWPIYLFYTSEIDQKTKGFFWCFQEV